MLTHDNSFVYPVWNKRSGRLAGALMVALLVVSLAGVAKEEQKNMQPVNPAHTGMGATGPNPHGARGACNTCHQQRPSVGKLYLRTGDPDRLCVHCHTDTAAHVFSHPVSLAVPADMRKRMPAAMRVRLKSGKLSCLSCHTGKPRGQVTDTGKHTTMLRGGSGKTRSSFCYQCHDGRAYQRRNAHDQIDKRGRLKTASCAVCHEDSAVDGGQPSPDTLRFHVGADWSAMCTGCHKWIPHPGGGFTFGKGKPPNHLVIPSERVRTRMESMIRATGIVLPLAGDSRVTCATCHNPHAKGVIQLPTAAKGAGEPKRLRSRNICRNCHDK